MAMRVLLPAALGGLLMGIGARLAFGCNIGGLVGGISSGSLHGFVWFAAALPGTQQRIAEIRITAAKGR